MTIDEHIECLHLLKKNAPTLTDMQILCDYCRAYKLSDSMLGKIVKVWCFGY